MKNERELFEAWHYKEYADKMEWDSKKEEYKDYIDEVMWQTWQASANREGFKLVPVEPTLKMVRASEHIKSSKTIRQDIYKAMIKEADE